MGAARSGRGREAIGRIDRFVDFGVEAGRQIGADVAAGREAHRADPLRVDPVARGAAADQPDRPLGVLEGRVRPRRPAFVGKSVEEDEGGDPPGGEKPSHLVAFLVDHHPIEAAARSDQDRGAVRPGGAEDGHSRPADPKHVAVVIGRVAASLLHRLDRQRGGRARRRAGPEVDRLGRLGRPHMGRVRGRRRGGLRRRASGRAQGEGSEQE